MNGNRIAVVTGGGRGIGRAISRRLALAGYDIVLSYRTDAASAETAASEIREIGQRALCVQADITVEISVIDLFAAAEAFGPVTAVVNNAGAATAVCPLDSNDLEAVRRDLEVNLFGVVVCSKYAARAITRAGGGAMVNVSSVAATLGGPGMYVHYAAAKAGVNALTVGLSKELAPDIRVNAVSPGTIWSEFHQDPQRPAQVAPTVPLGRAGDAEEIAGAVAWLLSDEASYVTGANIKVSGGL